jgi:hypothetical protein
MITLLLVIYLLIGVIYTSVNVIEGFKEGLFDNDPKYVLVVACIASCILWPMIYAMTFVGER